MAMAQQEGRIILTRDHGLYSLCEKKSFPAILIEHDLADDQIKQVFKQLQLGPPTPQHLLTLCLECNEPLLKVLKNEVEDRVPSYILDTEKNLRLCPKCRRVYWQGTHWSKMRARLHKLLEDKELGEPEDKELGELENNEPRELEDKELGEEG